MIFRTLVICVCLSWSFADRRQAHDDCLTGYMTNRQSWVDEFGKLTVSREKQGSSIDISRVRNPVHEFQTKLNNMKSMQQPVKYLSFANCDLFRVPLVFKLPDHHGRPLSESLEYLTFYGNNFVTISMPGREYDVIFNATDAVESAGNNYRSQGDVVPIVWSSGFRGADFSRLKELDLRSCSIQVLSSREFLGMMNLEALYIGENEIFFIEVDAFVGLRNLQHLDFSRNYPIDHDGNPSNLATEPLFQMLTNLVSLDLSHTVLIQRNQGMLTGLGKKLKSLSLCNTGLRNLRTGIFSKTSIEILDISRNIDILAGSNVLKGIEKTLTVLFANEIGLKSVDIFKDFKKLEILQLSNNEIVNFKSEIAKQLKNLQILDLDRNRLTSWFTNTFSVMPNLRLLSLKDNNINVISEKMINDMKYIDYLALSENFLICDCNVKEFYKMAAVNEQNFNNTEIIATKSNIFHIGYDYYNNFIFNRNAVEYDCQKEYCKDVENSGTFRLIDNYEGSYSCLKLPDSIHVPFFDVKSCNMARDIKDYENNLNTGRLTLLILLVIPFLLLPLLFVFIFRRNLRYCCITIRNSATLSLINKNVVVEDGAIFNYDVFVSYCNEDRGWVLDHLLPHIESDSSISACLHERDFQVGLSILENIVSCMDRSRAIMLIISQRFLLSQWCQFEMHLAQHRLLETRREDLILVLLEDIPRSLRPNTLHYLMLTKTYIVWPKQKSERTLFWKRLNKSLLSQKSKGTENVSLA